MPSVGNLVYGVRSPGLSPHRQVTSMNRDLRKYAGQTNFRLIVGFILILFLVGDGLIYLFFGRGAAIMGIVCLMAALIPVILILFAFWFMDWIVRHNNQE
jgi:hypothetical protein